MFSKSEASQQQNDISSLSTEFSFLSSIDIDKAMSHALSTRDVYLPYMEPFFLNEFRTTAEGDTIVSASTLNVGKVTCSKVVSAAEPGNAVSKEVSDYTASRREEQLFPLQSSMGLVAGLPTYSERIVLGEWLDLLVALTFFLCQPNMTHEGDCCRVVVPFLSLAS